MAGTIVINGRETGRPGIYSVPEFLRLQSRPPLSAILAIVGEFPFLEQNVPYLSTTQAAFDALSFSSVTRKRLSNIIFDASEDPAIQSSPAGVYLVSPTTVTQAFGYLQDSTPANAVKIKARQWGKEGNRTHFSIVALADPPGGWKFTARNGSYVESNVRIKAEPALMKLAYAEPAAGPTVPTGIGTVGGGDSGNVKLAVANGVVSTTFTQVISDTYVYAAGGATLSWDSDIPVDGVLTFNASGAATMTTGPLTIKVTGVDKDTGVSATTSITWTKIDIEAQTAKPTTIEYTGPVTVIFEYPALDAFTGEITITGNVFPDFSAADGQTYVGDVIRYIAGYSAVGFSTSTESTRTSSAKLEDLDDLTAATLTDDLTTTNGILTADLWKIVTTINTKSLLVEAERLTDKPPVITTTATSFFLAGGTETTATADDWEAAFEELRWYDVDVVAPFYDPTGTAAADDTILPKLTAHIETMWSDGANERIAWMPAGTDEAFNELLARVSTFGDYRISMPVDGVSMVQYNNQSEDLDPYWTAVLMAAMDASTNGLIPFTWRSPRITSSSRNSTLYTNEYVEEMIQSGMLFFTEPPGRAPQVERDITTFTEQDDPRRTERVAVRSLMLSLKFMRAALRRFIVSADGTIASLADVRGGVIQELERQKNFRVFKSYDASKVVITPYNDRYDVAYEFVPLYPINFIVLRAKVTAPVPIP